jgi:4-alpha-glucanotransferase
MHRHHSVVYTGTHDNDTTVGWFATLDSQTQRRVATYLGSDSMPQALIRAACASVAQLAVVPMQDLLGLGSAARFNTPGTVKGNWSWKLPNGALNHDTAQHYAGLNRLYARA